MAMFSEACLEAVGVTNQDKIKYLKRFSLLDKEIDRKLEEVAYWRGRLEQVTSIASATPKGGGSIYCKTESIVAKIVDLEQEINRDIDRLVGLRENIKNIIAAVEDDRERLLLQYRYIDCKAWEQIAVDMHYNWRWVHRIHKKALEKLNWPVKASVDM